MVPVVRACDAKSVDEIQAELVSLAERGRAGTLAPEELRGSTFTVTSAGKLGGLFTTPIVNHPEVAILSIGRIAERPVVQDGDIVARPMGTIAVTFDHRVIDGARAAEFGLAVIKRLEASDVSAGTGTGEGSVYRNGGISEKRGEERGVRMKWSCFALQRRGFAAVAVASGARRAQRTTTRHSPATTKCRCGVTNASRRPFHGARGRRDDRHGRVQGRCQQPAGRPS